MWGSAGCPTILDCSGNREGGDSRIGADRTGCRICDKGCGRHGDTSGDRCKFAGCFIVGIVGIQNKRCAVQRCSQVGQARRESISDNNSGCGIGSGITGVLNLERVGQSSVFSNRDRADRIGAATTPTVSSAVMEVIPPPSAVTIFVIADSLCRGANAFVCVS